MDAILVEMIELLTGGLVTMAQGIGEGLNAFASNIFITTGTDGDTLSVFGGIIVAFAGISLAVALGKLVLHTLCNLGGGRY